MPLQFNNTVTYHGIVQRYEEELGFDFGDISGSEEKLKALTARVNTYLARFQFLAIRSSGRWQYDDTNHTDLPVVRTNLVSGQRIYPFLGDEGGNLILDFFRVRVADASGNFSDITPVDMQKKGEFGMQDTGTGTPTTYDKTGNALILGTIPNYNYTLGLEAYINRTSSYFAYNDTTKKPGIPGIFHDYLALGPAADSARINSLARRDELLAEVLRLEQSIQTYFSERPRDERPRLTVSRENNR